MRVIRNNLWFIFHIIMLLIQRRNHEARIKFLRKYSRLLKRYFTLGNHNGVDIINEEWDYLIVLDACRYDDFEKVYPKYIKGELKKKNSRGSDTTEWLSKNFDDYYEDIIYVSANPHCSDYHLYGFKGTDHFYQVENVWKYGWNEDLDTVPPEKVTEAAFKLKNAYPDKKIIIHYIQPHGPWIGKTRVSLDKIGDPTLAVDDGRWKVDIKAWRLAQEGRLDVKLLRQATLDNLELVLGEVQKLIDKLDGRIIVTADHGEAFGEKFVFGHSSGIYTKELTEIPWFIVKNGKKIKSNKEVKNYKTDKNHEVAEEDNDKLVQRLRALGYMD